MASSTVTGSPLASGTIRSAPGTDVVEHGLGGHRREHFHAPERTGAWATPTAARYVAPHGDRGPRPRAPRDQHHGRGGSREPPWRCSTPRAQQSWLARAPLGYVVTRYDDVVGDPAGPSLPPGGQPADAELSGITDPEFLARRRVSILTAEGDEHGRLRRLVAPAFTPKAADRLRPFMREVVNELARPALRRRAHRARGRRVRALPDPHHLRAPRRARRRTGSCSAAWAPDILRIFNFNFERGPADHHAGPGRAGCLRPRS